MTTIDPYRPIAARIRAVLRAAGVRYATSHASRIRGWRTWTSGVTVERPRGQSHVGIAWILPRYDIRDVRERDLAAAVSALRAVGWTVTDEGDVLTAPDVPARGKKETP